jgi:hypothetical protein
MSRLALGSFPDNITQDLHERMANIWTYEKILEKYKSKCTNGLLESRSMRKNRRELRLNFFIEWLY